MDEAVRTALAGDRVVDITTYGRRTGEAKRIEIWIHAAQGRYFITGRPGRRSWHANLFADPRIIVHLKRSITADVPGRARVIRDPAEKESVLRGLSALREFVTEETIGAWVAGSPLVEVSFEP